MVLTIATKREFIPKFNGNDKAPAAEQIKILHKAPTIEMKEKLYPKQYTYGADGKVFGTMSVDRKALLSEFILDSGLLNIAYQMDDVKDHVIKVKSVDDLFLAPPEYDGLIDELYAYFQGLLSTKVNEKNSA